MANSLRDLRKKIKSISGTKKITKAMEMISASKMNKAIRNAQSSRNYSNLAQLIITSIGTQRSLKHPLLAKRSIKKSLIIVIASNKGLCGSLNAQVFKKANAEIKRTDNNLDIVTMGNRSKNYIAKNFPDKLIADFPFPDRSLNFSDIKPISKFIIDDYINKSYDKVCIIYNQFISTLKQEAKIRQLLPLKLEVDQEEVEEVKDIEYKLEPNPEIVLNAILPKILETEIYQILLESSASEHSARMIAMKNASDNASELISNLQLTYNSIRQSVITTEISEITSGSEALKSNS